MTFNLINGSYKPYKKPNGTLLYINKNSNHPPHIIKKLQKTINDRLCKNSSNVEIFYTPKIEYEPALKNSGYENVDFKHNLAYKNITNKIDKGTSYGLVRHLAKQCQQMLQNNF